MARTKIDYGIDLGTTNSAIARIEQGEVVIKKALDTQKDTTPSAIAFNKKGNMMVGDAGYRAYKTDSLRLLTRDEPMNSFVEFKRTMGTDKTYYSPNADQSFSSEDLSSGILKRLKEYIQDEAVPAAVITIPAAFKNNQIDATRKAAKLAGINYVEMLQEPISAAMAYGVENTNQDGFWLVFDFGGGTFDAALLKVEEGIIKVVDTEGDNYLGGKNLDYAIVDQILIPHIQEEFEIDNLLSDDLLGAGFRNSIKYYAEEIKNNLSLQTEHALYVDPGDCGEDDNGDEIEIDLELTRDELAPVMIPIFQKAIDCCKTLLTRNNLDGNSLATLILVGGPTLSPIVREMLAEQICTPNTTMDPMTVVARGAALYASTLSLPDDIVDEARDRTKVQLEVTHAASTVEEMEFVAIKTLPEKTEGAIPDGLMVQITRNDHAWESGKVALNELGDVIDVLLAEGKTNLFTIKVFDAVGNPVECEPSSFSIIQGSVVGSATLPYNIGIEIQDIETGKIIFRSVKGLEKNKSLPAQGVINGLKTPQELRPGMKDDFIEISVYQGEHGADGTRAIHNHHVSTIYITGEDLPSLLPKDSEVDITLEVDRSQKITGTAYFTYLDFEYHFETQVEIDAIDASWLDNEFRKAETSIRQLRHKQAHSAYLDQLEQSIRDVKREYEKNKSDTDTKQQALSNLRKYLKEIDKLEGEREWPDVQAALTEAFNALEKLNREKGSEQTGQVVDKLRSHMNQVVGDRDIKSANRLLEEIGQAAFDFEKLDFLIGMIYLWDQDFNDIPWLNAATARRDINRAKELIYAEPSFSALLPIWIDLYDNGQFKQHQENDGESPISSILRG